MELTRSIDEATNKVSNSLARMHIRHPAGVPPYSSTASNSPFSTLPWELVPTDHRRRRVVRIDVLPDDVLLGIFGIYTNPSFEIKREIEAWQTLVHVCRRWRYLVFGSPRHLNLHLFCTSETRAMDKLNVWPAIPLFINAHLVSNTDKMYNVLAALGQRNRVSQVVLDIDGRKSEEILAPMHVSFPELTRLQLNLQFLSYDEPLPIITDSFLGGSAPRLRLLGLYSVSFPGLPKLLLSATHLVDLFLHNIPHSGYFSPQAIVDSLSVLSGLQAFHLEFRSPQSRPDWGSRHPPPPKRSVLPALYIFRFKGVTEYFEELVAGIDAPQVSWAKITFFNQINFDCPQLAQFIDCTPALRGRDEAHVQFNYDLANVILRHRTSDNSDDDLSINILCKEPDRQLSSIKQVYNFLPHLSLVEDLYIEHRYGSRFWTNGVIENTLWLELLLPFNAVKNLYLSKEFAPDIAAALQERVGGRITDVLPSLQNILVKGFKSSGLFQGNIEQFLAARQLLDHPITISVWT